MEGKLKKELKKLVNIVETTVIFCVFLYFFFAIISIKELKLKDLFLISGLALAISITIFLASRLGLKSFSPWLFEKINGKKLCFKTFLYSTLSIYFVVNLAALLGSTGVFLFRLIIKDYTNLFEVFFQSYFFTFLIYNYMSLFITPIIIVGVTLYWNKKYKALKVDHIKL